MLEVRSNLRTVANAVAAASHLPRSSSQAPASVIDRLQPESEGIAPADTDTDTDTDTDAFSEREMLKCLAGAEEIPQRAQGRLVCYREEMERLQEALRDEYTLLLVLSPLDQQVRIATSQQQWEANLASRCTTDRNGGKPGRPFMSGYQCRIDAIRGRIKALRETI
jgi:hypothetical protein